jgi:hypothetical protein
MNKKEIKNNIIEREIFIKYSSDDDKIKNWEKEINELKLSLNQTLRQELLDLGFIEIPNYTITNSITYDLGRNRYIIQFY